MPVMPHVTVIAGARPNFVKIAALIPSLQAERIQVRLVHTGQHYDYGMSMAFFEELELPEPDCFLGVGSRTPPAQIAEIMRALEAELLANRPDCVIVVGDVNSTLAAALCANRLGIRVAHVEAGLRSFDRSMPEEINRTLTDAISDWLFVTEPSAIDNLRREGISESRVFFVGNVMIDTLVRYLPRARRLRAWEQFGVEPRGYVVATLHRPSNVDSAEVLAGLLEALSRVARELPVVFPVHPRTKRRIEEFGLGSDPGSNGYFMVAPLPYLQMLSLVMSARLVITDSGGLQEETTYLGVPCITARENTERPVTVLHGTNRVVGCSGAAVWQAAQEVLVSDESSSCSGPPPLWDGRASERIARILREHIGKGAAA